MANTIVEITRGAEEIAELLKRGKPVFLDHYIDGCPPCMQLAKMLPGLAKKYPGVIFAKLKADEDHHAEYVESQEIIAGFPWVYLYDAEGNLVNEDVPFSDRKEIIAAIEAAAT